MALPPKKSLIQILGEKGKITREIDLIKKSRGEEKNKVSGLRLDTVSAGRY